MNDKKIVSKKNSEYFFTEVYIVITMGAVKSAMGEARTSTAMISI